MQKKRNGVLIFLLLVLLLTAVMQGSSCHKKFTLTLTDGEKSFTRDYQIPFKTRLRVLFKHKGSYSDFYDKEENKREAFDEIHPSLYPDVNNFLVSLEQNEILPKVSRKNRVFSYHEGRNGIKVDKETVFCEIFSSFSDNISIHIQKEEYNSGLTIEKLKEATRKMSSFTTSFHQSSIERKHNIQLAAKLIDGSIIAPHGTFSFNETVGARTEERGFQKAHIIENGKFVEGVGGGVCQVSTTLYNAALLSGLSAESVSRHSLPIGYVPLSFDAMVSSRTDLKLKNASDFPVYIDADTDSNKITFTFYGLDTFDGERHLRSEVIKELVSEEYDIVEDDGRLSQDEEERIIKKPRSGYQSEGYIDYIKNGEIISSEKIRKDTYKTQKGVKMIRNRASSFDSFLDLFQSKAS